MVLSVPGQIRAQTGGGTDTRPNIVVFLSDDLPWGLPGFNGGKEVPTPNMDRIANEGVKLTQFYVQPVCTPTRASLLTGRYPWKNGTELRVSRTASNGMLLDERTIAETLRAAGYATWMVGKWHLGQWDRKHLPLQRGFDHHYGLYSALISYFSHLRDGVLDWFRNGRPVVESGYATFLLADEAVQLIERHDGSRPFFLYLPWSAVHDPYEAPAEYFKRYRHLTHPTLKAMLAAMDDATGEVMGALQRKGFLDDTLVVFLNDNGGAHATGNNGSFKGNKEEFYEGGIRVPAALRWPGEIPAGSESNALLHVVDLFPTFAKLAGADTSASLPLDGIDAWQAIAKGAESPRQEVVHSLQVIRVGDWKLIEEDASYYNWKAGFLQLYNISEDPYEKTNLAASETEKVAELRARLTYHQAFARDAEPFAEIPDYPPVMYGQKANAAFGTEVQRALRELNNGNPGPELLRISAFGSTVRLIYREALNTAAVPPANAFTVVLNPGYRSEKVSGVRVSGSEVVLTLAEAVPDGDRVGLTYEVPDTGAIRDTDGLAANGVTWVTTTANAVTPPPPPPGGGGGGGGGGVSPTRPPGVPTNLAAVAGDREVALSWVAPEDEGSAVITGYEYLIDGRNNWVPTGSTETTHTVTGLANGVTYAFQVRAVNGDGRRSRATEPVEARPRAQVVLDFTHFANGTSITSDLVFVNPETQPVRPTIYFYDTEGTPIAAESVVDITGDLEVAEDGGLTVRTEMAPLEVLTISTHGRGDLVTGSVRVVSDGPLGALVRYTVPPVGVAAVGASPPVRDVTFPARRREGGMRTEAALHNLGEAPLQVSCRLMSGGAVLEEVVIPLVASGQTSWPLDAAFTTTDTSDFAGTVRCTAPGMFTAIAVEMDAGNGIFTTLPMMPVSRGLGGETELDFAHFANGEGWSTDLVFVNRETQVSGPPLTPFHREIPPIRPVIYFYGLDGQPLAPESVVDITGDLEIQEDGGLTARTAMAPLEVLTISTHGLGDLLTGSVRVVSDGPLGGMLRFDHPGIGEAVVGASPPISTAIFPVRRQEKGINTGVAIHNLESSSELVRCDLMREGVLHDSVMIPLEANGQTSWSLNSAFTTAETSDFAGSVRCEAVGEGAFTAVGLEMDPGTRTFITLPVVPIEERMPQE